MIVANVGNVWNVGIVCEFRRKKCVVDVPMEIGRFRVALYIGWAI